MSASSDKFSDLTARMSSAAVMAVVGIGAIWVGGAWFTLLVYVICGALVWELTRMLGIVQNVALALAAVAVASLFASWSLFSGSGLLFLFIPAIAGVVTFDKHRLLHAAFAFLIMIACMALLILRVDGVVWMLWLALVVIATDVLGYFAGRIIGGPKFWPKVSPKKTWSGTSAGWVAAAVVGAFFIGVRGVGFEVVMFSVLVSMASQAGDVAESALKRKMGVKDSSNLIPGHGGFFDRFDGMLGAAVILLPIMILLRFPPIVN
ncbi:MAG: phosphatidate cytidylyltransferase [Litoreibacter sp.]|uniref:phosphatidate cytidylyltransferase n=1 Tax=Litoreibacter sp. TaxID=1969459 RepID=UPI003297E416